MILASEGPCQAKCAETSPASDPTPSKQREPTLQRRGWVNGEHFDLQPASALASASAARASLCATSSCSSCLDSPKPGRADVAVRKDLACEPQLARPAAGVPRPRPSPGTGSMGKHWDVLGLSLRKCCPSDRLSLGTAGVRPRLGYGEPPLLSSARERPSVPCPLPAQQILVPDSEASATWDPSPPRAAPTPKSRRLFPLEFGWHWVPSALPVQAAPVQDGGPLYRKPSKHSRFGPRASFRTNASRRRTCKAQRVNTELSTRRQKSLGFPASTSAARLCVSDRACHLVSIQ